MRYKYIKPIILIEKIEENYLLSNSYNMCECMAHRGKHIRCGNGCHNSLAEGHKENNFYIYEEYYE